MIIQKGNLEIRKMLDCCEDYELMAKWFSDEKVLKYYEGRGNQYFPFHPKTRNFFSKKKDFLKPVSY